jgi:hypothetical protein
MRMVAFAILSLVAFVANPAETLAQTDNAASTPALGTGSHKTGKHLKIGSGASRDGPDPTDTQNGGITPMPIGPVPKCCKSKEQSEGE